jgi:hypothetical protein
MIEFSLHSRNATETQDADFPIVVSLSTCLHPLLGEDAVGGDY